MKTLYLHCLSGISGDMFLGAMIDLGFKPSTLEWELQKLNLSEEFHLHVTRENRKSISAIRFEVHEGRTHGDHCESGHEEHEHHHEHEKEHSCECDHDHDHEEGHSCDCDPGHDSNEHHHDHAEEHSCGCDHGHVHGHEHHHHDHEEEHSHEHQHGEEARSYASIKKLIEESSLEPEIKDHAASIFLRIAKAEAKVHGKSVEEIHFHEVGALDSIVDIIGAAVAIHSLGVEQVEASPLIDGKGWLHCQHGRLPIPAPATIEILQGIPITQEDVPYELITPTGAAILAEYCTRYGGMENFQPEKTGYGAGGRNLKDRPNVLRATLGFSVTLVDGAERDEVVQIECNLDDETGESLAHTALLLHEAGALDVSFTPLHMKKGRPGWLLQALAEEALLEKLSLIILKNTSSLGLRYQTWKRIKLKRDISTVKTPYGDIRVKRGILGTEVLKTKAEFEDVHAAAIQHNVSMSEVTDAALLAANLKET